MKFQRDRPPHSRFLRYLIKLIFVLTSPRISYIIFIIQICFFLCKMWAVMIYNDNCFSIIFPLNFTQPSLSDIGTLISSISD